MRSRFLPLFAAVAIGAGAMLLRATAHAAPPPPPPPPQVKVAAHPLSWDAMRKTHRAAPGEVKARFVFSVVNTGKEAVEIRHVQAACGCTAVDLPAPPWVLAPGESSSLAAVMDFTGKEGTLAKTLSVDSTAGMQTLTIAVEIPARANGSAEQVR